ncbi:putative NAD-dependent epimerase/dehydratase [Thozetella sp. PMI_491]|nr:putative NAD-dependent epimerase/dehydratase [Thozetella sp. PMI_491]
MHLLILGGTSFVGRAITNESVLRGHRVTVFNRGTRPCPPGAAQLTGDRLAHDGHAALAGKKFDAVIDTWQFDAIAIERALAILKGNVKHYTYVSTISVYYDAERAEGEKLSERSPVVDPSQPGLIKYCVDKRRSELALLNETDLGAPLLIARPGLIFGPGDSEPRLPWWLWRLERGDKTLAPGPKDLGLRYVDSRDLASFLIDGAERQLEGIFNVIGQERQTTMGELLETANEIIGKHAELVWKTPEEIMGAGIKPWDELPIWIPGGKEYEFVHNGDTSKAYAAGLRVRPIRDTLKDTWDWLLSVALSLLDNAEVLI